MLGRSDLPSKHLKTKVESEPPKQALKEYELWIGHSPYVPRQHFWLVAAQGHSADARQPISFEAQLGEVRKNWPINLLESL